MSEREAFRVRLCQWCEERGWNSADLARHLGVTSTKVWYWMSEGSPRVPDCDGLRLLLQAGFSVSGETPFVPPCERIAEMMRGWDSLSPEFQRAFMDYAEFLIGGKTNGAFKSFRFKST